MSATPSLLDIVDVFSCCVLTWDVFTVMLPAFILAGAIAVFVPPPVLLRYFGAQAKRSVAYGAAAISGCILSVCSCNIVPLFISIYRRGAGLGPAITFLYAGPAINLVSLIFVFQVIGWRLGIWRALGVPVIAVLIGGIMALLFRREEAERSDAAAAAIQVQAHPTRRILPFLLALVLIMIVGSLKPDQVFFMTWLVKGPALALLVGIVALMSWKWFETDELREWGLETWRLIKMVVPILLISVIIIGYIALAVKLPMLKRLGLIGQEGDSIRSALLTATFGSFMYFPILTEVAFTKAFLTQNQLPTSLALVILLTGSGLSLPGMILVGRAIGVKKVAAYVVVLIILTAVAGLVFGHYIGQYWCPCMD